MTSQLHLLYYFLLPSFLIFSFTLFLPLDLLTTIILKSQNKLYCNRNDFDKPTIQHVLASIKDGIFPWLEIAFNISTLLQSNQEIKDQPSIGF